MSLTMTNIINNEGKGYDEDAYEYEACEEEYFRDRIKADRIEY